MKNNLWLIALVVVALGLGLYYYLASPRPDSQGSELAYPKPPASEASRTRAPDVPRAPMPTPPRFDGLPHVTDAQLRKKGARAPRPLPGALGPLPGLSGKPGSPGGPRVNISAKYPLPRSTELEVFADPQGRFRLALPRGWSAEPTGTEEGSGPQLRIKPPAGGEGNAQVQAAVYVSRMPPVPTRLVYEKLVAAVGLRGEKLIDARKVRDGSRIGLEIVSEVPNAGEGPALRQRAFFVSHGSTTLQFMARAPVDSFERHAPVFYAMSRSLAFGTKR